MGDGRVRTPRQRRSAGIAARVRCDVHCLDITRPIVEAGATAVVRECGIAR
jgi:hypothetical protein